MPREVEIVFTPQWSNGIDGVKLFEMMTTISKDIVIRYKDQKIYMRMPKIKDWLYVVIEILERSEQMQYNKAYMKIDMANAVSFL